jgi:hypothetical protein
MAKRLCTLLFFMVVPLLSVFALPPVLEARQPAHFFPQKARFSVKFKNEISPYSILGVFVTPGEILPIEATESTPWSLCVLRASEGKVTTTGFNKWEWQAPQKPGLYPVTITRQPSMDSMTLNIFVIIPTGQVNGQCLNGYRIGAYPLCSPERSAIYGHPSGFVEVTRENEETLLSPHFKLKQFVCKQEGGYPKYVVLEERLLLKLEFLLGKANQEGYQCETFSIMSGYRTPYYNKCIGNVKYSCHLWGKAADIFIDENPKDGMMDDLNRDFRVDYRDATRFSSLVEKLHKETSYRPFLGGLASYKSTSSHGPFVHVDVRGFLARWGE